MSAPENEEDKKESQDKVEEINEKLESETDTKPSGSEINSSEQQSQDNTLQAANEKNVENARLAENKKINLEKIAQDNKNEQDKIAQQTKAEEEKSLAEKQAIIKSKVDISKSMFEKFLKDNEHNGKLGTVDNLKQDKKNDNQLNYGLIVKGPAGRREVQAYAKLNENGHGFTMGFKGTLQERDRDAAYEAMAEKSVLLLLEKAKKDPNIDLGDFKVSCKDNKKAELMREALRRQINKHKKDFENAGCKGLPTVQGSDVNSDIRQRTEDQNQVVKSKASLKVRTPQPKQQLLAASAASGAIQKANENALPKDATPEDKQTLRAYTQLTPADRVNENNAVQAFDKLNLNEKTKNEIEKNILENDLLNADMEHAKQQGKIVDQIHSEQDKLKALENITQEKTKELESKMQKDGVSENIINAFIKEGIKPEPGDLKEKEPEQWEEYSASKKEIDSLKEDEKQIKSHIDSLEATSNNLSEAHNASKTANKSLNETLQQIENPSERRTAMAVAHQAINTDNPNQHLEKNDTFEKNADLKKRAEAFIAAKQNEQEAVRNVDAIVPSPDSQNKHNFSDQKLANQQSSELDRNAVLGLQAMATNLKHANDKNKELSQPNDMSRSVKNDVVDKPTRKRSQSVTMPQAPKPKIGSDIEHNSAGILFKANAEEKLGSSKNPINININIDDPNEAQEKVAELHARAISEGKDIHVKVDGEHFPLPGDSRTFLDKDAKDFDQNKSDSVEKLYNKIGIEASDGKSAAKNGFNKALEKSEKQMQQSNSESPKVMRRNR